VSRYLTAVIAPGSTDPFAAWPLFGQLLLNSPQVTLHEWSAGIAFHVVNGLGFGLAYFILVRKPTVWTGIAWGLGLELFMALLYPRWLVIAQLSEFLQISVVGHFFYGAVLGTFGARYILRPAFSVRDHGSRTV
jgi:hypothetical protein